MRMCYSALAKSTLLVLIFFAFNPGRAFAQSTIAEVQRASGEAMAASAADSSAAVPAG